MNRTPEYRPLMSNRLNRLVSEEHCPHCDALVWVTPCLTINNLWDICPSCKEPILCCNMCVEESCVDCKYEKLKPITMEVKSA